MEKEKIVSVGGQAVIEGVMMKSPEGIATAVRRKDGQIVYRKKTVSKSNAKLMKIPFIRGVVILLESLFVGTGELTFAANQAGEEEEELTKPQLILTLTVSLLFGMGLFIILPSIIGGVVFRNSTALSSVLEGLLRVIIFLSYIYLISRNKEIKRVFQYHGAEHKSIYVFENKEELEFENAKKYTTLHPRCGTSFLFIVMMVSILIYSTLDVIIPKPDTHLMRILLKVGIRFGFMPIVAGLSYEIQKYSSRHMDNPLISLLALPGLKLQNITTQEPDESQLEVGMTALRASLNMEVNAINIEEEQK
ncbi:MAG: DUF1385 domain-containing protein [Fusobacteriaceae bacterium]|nr:DUF1385 domain-containing protein [Fusobacteriaceae bacterium]MBN2837580.1 DUF1385 domain-containing protein [Fusobacteriaceae bacterium]